MGEILGNWYSYFCHSMSIFFPLDSHPMVYFVTWKMDGFPHQFSTAQENEAKSIKLQEPGKLVPILSPKYEYFPSIRFLSYGILYHMGNAWLFPSISDSTGNCSKIHPMMLFFHSITFSTCSKIWRFTERTNRKKR